MIEGLRSCGSWIRDALHDIPEILRSVKLIRSEKDRRYLKGFFDKERPLYISIDKDVLAFDVCPTNWDQGDMDLRVMLDILRDEVSDREIAGVDICGGPSLRDASDTDIRKNESVDREIIDFLRSYVKGQA